MSLTRRATRVRRCAKEVVSPRVRISPLPSGTDRQYPHYVTPSRPRRPRCSYQGVERYKTLPFKDRQAWSNETKQARNRTCRSFTKAYPTLVRTTDATLLVNKTFSHITTNFPLSVWSSSGGRVSDLPVPPVLMMNRVSLDHMMASRRRRREVIPELDNELSLFASPVDRILLFERHFVDQALHYVSVVLLLDWPLADTHCLAFWSAIPIMILPPLLSPLLLFLDATWFL
ncbi:hypothetical protein BDM02DRAFT_1744889 [Thelephora ganbajun]|uniref:Uncharacterized protein n=1 Tax=Thelephora ganbajun TaxID=370292 RepID=A0ACB6Z0B6_THEGA|nr:hypothetical protein BDM02DRAFT_1744889 [Thelephora ganbajun]